MIEPKLVTVPATERTTALAAVIRAVVSAPEPLITAPPAAITTPAI